MAIMKLELGQNMVVNSATDVILTVGARKSTANRAEIVRTPHDYVIEAFTSGAIITSKLFERVDDGMFVVVKMRLRVGDKPSRKIYEINFEAFSQHYSENFCKSTIGSLIATGEFREMHQNVENAIMRNKCVEASGESHTSENQPVLLGLEETLDEPTEKTKRVLKLVDAKADNWLDGFFVSAEQTQAFLTTYAIAQRSGDACISLRGDSGYGKTSIAVAFAKTFGMPYHIPSMATVIDADQLFTNMAIVTLEDGTKQTTYTKNALANAIEAGNCMIVLDEINRATPSVLNVLLPLLDERKEVEISDLKLVAGKNIIWVMTSNVGAQFTGTYEMDSALTNRVNMTLNVGVLPQGIECDVLLRVHKLDISACASIVHVATELRKYAIAVSLLADISTRTTLNVASLVKTGFCDEKDAWCLALVNSLPNEDRKPVLDIINSVLVDEVMEDDDNEQA